MPGDAYNVSRHAETRTRRVPDGRDCHEECTNERVDRGDGSFSVERTCRDVCTTRYRDETYTVQVCDYSIDRWRDGREVEASGRGVNPGPEWPAYQLAAGSGSRGLGEEKVGERDETYTLHFRRENGEGTECEYDEMTVWLQYEDSQRVNMDFNIFDKPVCSSLKKIE
jgi:hypothetical protein